MRLKKSRVAAQEELIEMLNVGYQALKGIEDDYYRRTKAVDFDEGREVGTYEEVFQAWAMEVRKGLREIFPTELEASYFVTQEVLPRMAYRGMNQRVGELTDSLPRYLAHLKHILDSDLDRYTDLPIQDRLYVEDIDSFAKVL